MADVLADLNSWSATASSNSPTDATTIGSGLADNIQALQAVVRGYLAAKGTDIASSAAPDVAAVQGLYHDITGNNTITGLGTTGTAGIWKMFQTDGSPLFKHSTALQMVGATDRTASPGAVAAFICEASNQWRNLFFFNATAGAVVGSATTVQPGVIEVATNAETLAGTSDAVAVTPSALDSVLGLVKLATGTVSNTAIADVTMTAYTAYANKLLVFRNFVPATDAAVIWMRVSTDGGATFDAGASDYATGANAAFGSGATAYGGSAAAMILTGGNSDNVTASGGVSGRVWMYGTTDAKKGVFAFETGTMNSDESGFWHTSGGSRRQTAQDTDAVRLLFSSGNIGAGVWDLYGFN